MKRAKIVLLISILVIAGMVSVILWGNLQERSVRPDEAKAFRGSEERADARMEKIRFVEDRQGRKTWELEAKAIQQYQDDNVLMLEDVKVTVFTKDGRSFVITGQQGKVYQTTKNVDLHGDVLITSSDGYRLKTQSLSYLHAEKKVTTSDPVEVDGDQVWMAGRGMLVDVEARRFKVLKGVKTRWKGGGKG